MNDLSEILVLKEAPKPFLQHLGDGMQRHRGIILALQSLMIVFYLGLLVYPAFLPLPQQYFHLYENIILFAQFVFWGIWWPFVMLSMMLFGRLWCGVLCPEGALSEWASQKGLERAIPRWMRWAGWPFLAFAITTVYGQLISVYEYPKAALLILGGSTIAAVLVGFLYGKGTRVWCRYLCPASGVFSLLSRLAPLHFRIDRDKWLQASRKIPAVDCAPLINIRDMTGNDQCHMCGRCSNYKNAVKLSARSPNSEILSLPSRKLRQWDVTLLVFGIFGLATGAFQWSTSPWFIQLKQLLAVFFIDNSFFFMLKDNAPWWVLTHYPETNDIFTWLDGLCIVLYISATTLLIGGLIFSALWCSGKVLQNKEMIWRLGYGLTPLGGASIFLGLSGLTVSMLTAERIPLPYLPQLRATLLAIGSLWSAGLIANILSTHAMQISLSKKVLCWSLIMGAAGSVILMWAFMFFIW